MTAINDGPLNSTPAPQVTSEDTSLVFDTGSGNVISISDVDAGGSPLMVALIGTNGRITLSGTAGLTFSTGDGTSDANRHGGGYDQGERTSCPAPDDIQSRYGARAD